MEAVNLCDKCALNMSNYLNELNKDINIKYKYTMAKWRIERDRAKIKQLEAELKDHKKTISNQTESYAKALNYNNELEAENKRLGKALKKVADPKGAYDMDRLRHCENTVKNLVEIAQKALEK